LEYWLRQVQMLRLSLITLWLRVAVVVENHLSHSAVVVAAADTEHQRRLHFQALSL
jgi:hypothetical protein